MTRVKLEGVLEQLAPELRRALGSAVWEPYLEITVDEYALLISVHQCASQFHFHLAK